MRSPICPQSRKSVLKCPNCDSEKETYISDQWLRCNVCDAIVAGAPKKSKASNRGGMEAVERDYKF